MGNGEWALLALMVVFWVSLIGTAWQIKKPRDPDWRETLLARWTDEEAIRVHDEARRRF